MDDKERLFRYIEVHRKDLVETLRGLVRIDTHTPRAEICCPST